MTREYTNRLLNLIDEGIYDQKGLERLAQDLLGWLSEDDVREFWYMNGYGDLEGYYDD